MGSYYMDKHDLNDTKCRGRGQHLGFKLKPAIEKHKGDDFTMGGEEARLWSGISARLKDIRKAKEKCKNCMTKEMKDFFKERAQKIEEIYDNSNRQVENLAELDEVFANATLKAKLAMVHELNQGQLQALEEETSKRAKKADAGRRKQIGASVTKWVNEICSGNMRGAHKAISKEERYRPDIDETVNGTAAQDMVEVMDVKEDKWMIHWKEEDEEEQMRLFNDLEELRHDAAQTEPRGKCNPKRAKESTHHLNNNRSVGGDHWAPHDWQDLPHESYV